MRRGLSRKLSVAFVAGVLVAALTSALALWAALRTRSSTETALRRVATVARVSSGLRSIQLAEDQYMTSGEASDLQRFHLEWDATDRDVAELEALVGDPKTRATVADLHQLARDFLAEVDAQARALSGAPGTDDPAAFQAIVMRKAAVASELNRTSADLVDVEVARTAPELLDSFNRLLVLSAIVAISTVFGFAIARLVAARQEQLENEMDLARRIQTSVLPRDLEVEGLRIAACMVTASEVGGDYYEVLPVPGGCWLGIGDVSGHGLDAGLIMLMIQSVVAGVVKDAPESPPSRVLAAANEVVFDNVHERLGKHEHATLALVRYHTDGRIVFAGAHEEILVLRARDGRVETVATSGPWIGLVPHITGRVVDAELRLEDGDIVVLYTDGVTEAVDPGGEMFGSARLCAELERVHGEPVDRIRDRVLDAVSRWARGEVLDDMTLVIARYSGPVARATGEAPARQS